LFFRRLSAPFNKELAGVEPQKGDLQFRNFIKEVFFDSDTQVAVISGVASNLFNVLNSDEMVEGRERINAMAGSQRLLAHGLTAPFFPNFLEETERMALNLKVDSWKFYPGVVEREGEFPFWMDDEELMYPFLREDTRLRHESRVRPQRIAAARQQPGAQSPARHRKGGARPPGHQFHHLPLRLQGGEL